MNPSPSGRRLFGRTAELRAATALIRDGARLLTLHGPPGVGKSRLLRELAAGLRAEGRRVFRVSLSGARERSEVLSALARGLHIELGERRALEQLGEHLEDSADALMLDEVERSTDVLSDVIAYLLDTTERTVIVVASRGRIDLGDEVLLPVRGLDEASAIELFQDRLGRLGGSGEDLELTRQLVQMLDALPLSLELAASRARVVGRKSLVRALATDLGEGLGRARLRQLFEHSWDALDEPERNAIARLSVFRGPFDLDAATAVVGPTSGRAVFDILQSLADASLLAVDDDSSEGRFVLLGVVRAFAADALERRADGAETRERHAAHFESLVGVDDRALWTRLAEDRENLLSTWSTLQSLDPLRAARFALAIDPLLVTQGPPSLHREVLALALDATSRDEHPRLRAELLRARGRTATLRGRHREAIGDYREALALAAPIDERLGAWCASLLCFSLRAVGSWGEARTRGSESLAVAHRLEDQRLEAMCEQALGMLALAENDATACVAHERRAVAVAMSCNAPRLAAIAEANLGEGWIRVGDHSAAARALSRAREGFTAIEDRFHLAAIAPIEARLLRLQGHFDAAEHLLLGALETIANADDSALEVDARIELATLAHTRGDRDLARRRLDEALVWSRRTDDCTFRERLAALSEELEGASRLQLTIPPKVDVIELVVFPGGARFALGGREVDLSRRGALRRVLSALFAARIDRPGEALDLDAIRRAGWPGESMHPESAAARVYMAIRRLRALGLERALLTRDDGYLIDPVLPVRLADRMLGAVS